MAKEEKVMRANAEDQACFRKALVLVVLFMVALVAVYLTAGHCHVANAATRGHRSATTADVDWRLDSRLHWDGGNDLHVPRFGMELEKIFRGTMGGLWGGAELEGEEYGVFLGPDLVLNGAKVGVALGYESAAKGYGLVYALRARYESSSFAVSGFGLNRYNGDLEDLSYQVFLEARALPVLALVLMATDPAVGGGVKILIPGGVELLLAPAYNYEAGHPCLMMWAGFHAGGD